jgi:hypothetical protein
MMFEQVVYVRARGASLVREICQAPNFILAEAQFATANNELKPLAMFVVITPVTVRESNGGGEQSNLLVIPNCLDRAITGICQLTNSHDT